MALQTFKEGVKGDFVGSLVVNFLFHRLLAAGRRVRSKTPGIADEDHNKGKPDSVQEKGWSGLRFEGPAPSWHSQVWQVAVAYMGYDAMFYWTHRLMHHPKLYKHCHKIHHQYHTPIGIAATHQHPMEGFIQLFNWFLPIGFAGFLNRGNGGLHVSTLFYYNCFRWLETVDAHCGYEFPFSPFHLFPLCWSSRGHDYHHRAFDGVYGATRLWDKLCGTDADFWQEIAEEGLLMGGVRGALAA